MTAEVRVRRLGVTVVLGGVALALFLYVQPRLTIYVLANALKDSDTEAIRSRMDAESVRRSLRLAYVASLDRPPTEDDRSAAVIASLVLFGRGIEMIMATVGDDQRSSAEVTEWVFETSSRFRATLEQGTNPPFMLILERHATDWQVVAMVPSEGAWQQIGDTQPRQ